MSYLIEVVDLGSSLYLHSKGKMYKASGFSYVLTSDDELMSKGNEAKQIFEYEEAKEEFDSIDQRFLELNGFNEEGCKFQVQLKEEIATFCEQEGEFKREIRCLEQKEIIIKKERSTNYIIFIETKEKLFFFDIEEKKIRDTDEFFSDNSVIEDKDLVVKFYNELISKKEEIAEELKAIDIEIRLVKYALIFSAIDSDRYEIILSENELFSYS